MISPANLPVEGTEIPASYSAAVGEGRWCKPKLVGKGSSVDPPNPSVFRVGQRVMWHDKAGGEFYGVVKWTGREYPYQGGYKKFEYTIVGIKTVKYIATVLCALVRFVLY